jgi:signal transduction histidine kinase
MTILLANAAVELVIRGWPAAVPGIFLLSLFDVTLLFGYLSWGALRESMKTWYLPVGILLATLLPILEQHLVIQNALSGHLDNAALIGAWQMVLVLLIPLFIIGWQYSFRTLVLFCLAISLADMIPILLIPRNLLPSRFMIPIVGVMFVRLVAFLFIGYMVVRLMNTQRGLRDELTSANHRLAQYAGTLEHLTISRERNRLARELHDILAHTLSGVAVELEAVKALWQQDPARAQAMLDHSLKSTRDGLTETRRALQALRAAPLEDLGLSLALRTLAESAANRSNLQLAAQISEELPELPPEVEQCIYRVAQEALDNVSVHSGARLIQLSLARENGLLRLVVSDDGRGFLPNDVNAKVQFGLEGMRERAAVIGARLHIDTRVGGGTVVALEYGGTL